MSDALITFLITLPIGAIIGWIANKLLAPTFEEFGVRIKSWFITLLNKDEYSTYVIYSHINKTITKLHTEHGHSYFNAKKPYLNNHSINLEIKSKTKTQLRNVATLWIKQIPVDSYNESDIFFAGLRLLLPYLTKEHIEEIYKRHSENDQAGLWVFLGDIEKQTKGLLATNILDYVHKKQKEYEDLYTKDK